MTLPETPLDLISCLSHEVFGLKMWWDLPSSQFLTFFVDMQCLLTLTLVFSLY